MQNEHRVYKPLKVRSRGLMAFEGVLNVTHINTLNVLYVGVSGRNKIKVLESLNVRNV